jgi:hypothetical protein
MRLLKTRFWIDETARSAIAIDQGSNSSGTPYVDFFLCKGLYSETPTTRDAGGLGTLQITDDSDFSFTPDKDA